MRNTEANEDRDMMTIDPKTGLPLPKPATSPKEWETPLPEETPEERAAYEAFLDIANAEPVTER